MRAVLDHIDTLTSLCTTFWFKPDRRIRFNAGEFAEFYLPHPNPDDRGDKRWFTLCSSPHDPLVGITVKFATEHGSSFKATLQALSPGDEIFIGEPFGDFVLPKDPAIPLIFAAVGIGITPMVSIVRWIAQEQQPRDITLFHVVASPEDFLEPALFRAYTTYHPLVKTVHPEWHGATGVLTADMLTAVASGKTHPFIYLAGPKQSIQDLAHDLHEQGIARDQLAIDLFTGAIDLPKD